jgi:hypothetical protein
MVARGTSTVRRKWHHRARLIAQITRHFFPLTERRNTGDTTSLDSDLNWNKKTASDVSNGGYNAHLTTRLDSVSFVPQRSNRKYKKEK